MLREIRARNFSWASISCLCDMVRMDLAQKYVAWSLSSTSWRMRLTPGWGSSSVAWCLCQWIPFGSCCAGAPEYL